MIIKFTEKDQAAWIDIISLLLSVIPRLQNQASWMYFTIIFIDIIIQFVFETLIDCTARQCWFGCILQNT